MKRQIKQYLILILLVGTTSIPDLARAEEVRVVGEVSLSIGVARLIGLDGKQQVVERGMSVRDGERIETDDGGHVHIRFIDGAFVSVRPDSRLVVEAYKYNPTHPEENAIRFRLDKGVARSITGRGGEAAKDRFRLNTPIAAIGVKGTDFVVQVESDSVRVAVQSGAIVLAPLDDLCSASGLGPCNTAFARTLSADMGRVVMEFQRQQEVPRLVPQQGAQLTPDRVGTPATPEESRAMAPRHNDASSETLAAQAVIDARNVEPTQRPEDKISTTPVVLPDTKPVETPPVKNDPPPVDQVVIQPPVIVPPRPATLVWGRWTWVPELPSGTSTVSYQDARENGARESATGNIALATLMRPVSDPGTKLPTNLGIASFTMRDSEAYLLKNGTYSPGRVTDGWLRVDFGARKFDTSVFAEHADTGQINVSAAGKIDSKGVFLYNSPDTYVGGALSLDGQEAAYHFERKLAQGSLLGLTRWFK